MLFVVYLVILITKRVLLTWADPGNIYFLVKENGSAAKGGEHAPNLGALYYRQLYIECRMITPTAFRGYGVVIGRETGAEQWEGWYMVFGLSPIDG